MKEKRADLHVHTTYSDSSFSPEEVVRRAQGLGLSCIAITDHDSVDGIEQALAAALSCGVEVIPGVEMTAEEDKKELHILGYYIDYKDQAFLSVLRQIRQDRKDRLYKIADYLNKHGIAMDADDLIRSAGDISISRLHIAHYMEAKNLVSSWQEAFSRYIGDGKPCYVASFRYSPGEAIELIKKAGGIPVIAHPALNNIGDFLPKLIGQGIEGIEVFHSEHSSSVSSRYERYAREYGLVVTGGSDCHGSHKSKVLMGKVTIPYAYVEELKKLRKV